MKKSKNRTLLMITVLSIAMCGCPGVFLVMRGLIGILAALGAVGPVSDFWGGSGAGNFSGLWPACLGSVLLLMPIVLAIFTLIKRDKKGTTIKSLDPTGASSDDPIPPTR